MGPLLALTLAASRILLPPWPLSPDGEEVAVVGGEALVADGAAVACVAPGLWRVKPEAGARAVALRAGDATVAAAVEGQPGDIVIAARPPAAVKGRDETVALEIEIRSADGAVDALAARPIVRASTGRVRDLVPAGPGRFRAVYEPDATRHPEVAVLVALSPRCPLCPTPRAVGHAVVPLAAAIELPGETEPRAWTKVWVGGKRFGPVRADRHGRFSLPIVVPPGARVARAISTDRAGNRTVTRVDLGLPGAARLACVAWPEALPADGAREAAIWCAAADRLGRPTPPILEVRAGAGTVAPATKVRGSLARVAYRAPRGGAGTREAVTLRDATGAASEVTLELAGGAPERIAVVLGRDPVPLGATVPARADVLDARGDLIGRAAAPPGAKLGFVAPDRFVARPARGDGRQHAPLAFSLPPGPDVATLSLARQGRSWVAVARTVDARPAAGVPLRFGSGAEVATDARGEARAPARGAHETVVAANGARAAGWEGVTPPEAPFEILQALDVRLKSRNDEVVKAGP